MFYSLINRAIISRFKYRPELEQQGIGRLLDHEDIPLRNLAHIDIIDDLF